MTYAYIRHRPDIYLLSWIRGVCARFGYVIKCTVIKVCHGICHTICHWCILPSNINVCHHDMSYAYVIKTRPVITLTYMTYTHDVWYHVYKWHIIWYVMYVRHEGMSCIQVTDLMTYAYDISHDVYTWYICLYIIDVCHSCMSCMYI